MYCLKNYDLKTCQNIYIELCLFMVMFLGDKNKI